MKLIKSFLICFVIILAANSFVQAQNKVEPKGAVKMIKEFYSAYNTAWSANVTAKALDQSLDDLKMKYCAVMLIVELKGDKDHDILINDQFTDVQHLKTLAVLKDNSKENGYIVSYIAPTTNPLNKPVEEKVTIHLTVMKGARGIVIDSVCD
jgi:hypothetical protein